MKKTEHFVLQDTQCKDKGKTNHLTAAGNYIIDRKHSTIIHLGDHWDMPSLSSWDVGKKSFEGRRYKDDIESGIKGLETFLAPIRAEQKRLAENKKKRWNPRLVFTLGNHEQRIERAIESDAKLEGLIGYADLKLDERGWEGYDVVEVCVIAGMAVWRGGGWGRGGAIATQCACLRGHP